MFKKFKTVERCVVAEGFSPFVTNNDEDLILSFASNGVLLIDGKNRIETQVGENGENTVVVPKEFLKPSSVFTFQHDNGNVCRLPLIPIGDNAELRNKYEALKAKGEMQ